ncbi:hypothetical protein F4V43_17140 [Paenibacillus spiritus]|uniref:Flagellar protein FliT n=1 Tax=Paenibacillus spiritus TaxID=2496557 RepID=A0A5J5FVZ0_9BACL|nr:hypothetical protein [Paenibacillus spiritus]KAA8997978.1 hypothetical protein F4V43_17140 [Paenibacillus spiritus]
MANRVDRLEELTLNLLGTLSRAGYEEMASFVEQREEIAQELTASFEQRLPNSEEEEKLRELLAYDNLISSRMRELAAEASQWLLQRNQSKRQRTAYEFSYAPDSMMLDRRK